mmetsp:Transcript_70106/g.228074  ORF Transcript_70106/g.228074 Transcript_70106/m.228074 type:complete len:183 (+) Transcript_70106:144-692(+)
MSSGSSSSVGGGGEERALRSKGLLPAVGVGGALYLVAGAASLGTLAMVGIGAGVGYGVGGWLSQQYEKKRLEKKQAAGRGSRSLQQQAPPAASGQMVSGEAYHVNEELQISLMRWQAFHHQLTGGRDVPQPQMEQIFAQFSLAEPEHARNVQTVQELLKSQRQAEAQELLASGGRLGQPADV